MTARHEPTPEFRTFLESEIARTIRRETRGSLLERAGRGRLQTTVLVLAALVLGAAAGAVPGQVQDARQREDLLAAARSEEQLAALRLDLARSAADDARRKFEVGMAGRESVAAAQAEVRERELNIAKIRLNQEEIQATAAPPRDEISAPLAQSRDFVSERLRLDLAAVQQRLASIENAAAEVERRNRVGTAPPLRVLEAQSELARAKSEMQRLAGRLALRKDFLEQKLAVEDVEHRLQRLELLHDTEVAKALHGMAKERLDSLRKLVEIGVAAPIDVKRAEVELLERTAEMQALARRLEMLNAAKK